MTNANVIKEKLNKIQNEQLLLLFSHLFEEEEKKEILVNIFLKYLKNYDLLDNFLNLIFDENFS